MTDKTAVVFGNVMSRRTIRKAIRSKKKYIKKFGNDEKTNYPAVIEKNEYIGDSLGVMNIVVLAAQTGGGPRKVRKEKKKRSLPGKELLDFDMEKGVIVGNIRMGFGHYRISMAIASAAHSMGYTPYWMDLNSYTKTTGGKVIHAQNELYSMGSRLSQRSRLFNHFVWEPMNYEGFRRISYNAADQKNAELMTPVFRNIPKGIPLIATHVWPAQAAVHAGMKHVVNAIPDNWPMALHLSEGSVHTVQTHSAYLGYRTLRGMDKDKILLPMMPEDIFYTGHYIDHELVTNIGPDCAARLKRVEDGKPMRFLLTIGGAGAQREIFAAIIKDLIPFVQSRKAALFINVGDYKNVWEDVTKEIAYVKDTAVEHFGNGKDTASFAQAAISGDVEGIHGFWHENIFEAVYSTNLLMRCSDVCVTKPSELAFYPIPKIFIRRVGGHEQWGAVHSAEIGDGTLECRDIPHVLQMIRIFLSDGDLLKGMCGNIEKNKEAGIYNGAYKVVAMAMDMKTKNK